MMTDPVICEGHQELRDIVIETRADVKYIRESMQELASCQKDLDGRVKILESCEDQRVGENRTVTRHAGIVAGIIAILGTLVSIGYTVWHGSGG